MIGISGARALRRPGVDKLDLEHGSVDILVNNAGIYPSAAIEETSAE